MPVGRLFLYYPYNKQNQYKLYCCFTHNISFPKQSRHRSLYIKAFQPAFILHYTSRNVKLRLFYLKKYKMAVLNRHFDYFNFSLIRINTAAVCALVEFACGAKVPSVLPDIISCSDSQSTAFLA